VAVTPEDEIVGALLAFPPPNVIEQYVNGLPLASDQEKTQTIAGGIMILAKLRALAVDPDWQGRGIGVGLLDRFKDIYLACHYLYLYGQFRTDSGLADFYRAHGFNVLPPGYPLDLWVIFGIEGGVLPEAGEQIFYYRRAE
jgi:GNAT superfamily N-acetyltransferase